MNNIWHELKNLEETGLSGITVEVSPAPESLWFDGHFPGTPILPGIAQLAIVSDALQDFANRHGKKMFITGVRKVRFRQFIRPGDALRVTAAPDGHNAGEYKFRMLVNGRVACNGLMSTTPSKD
jgi:3-hydroxyacyl-[acyl-carrier-protein] dehydratase